MEKTINLLGIHPKRTLLCRIENIRTADKFVNVFIEPITIEQEESIEKAIQFYKKIGFSREDGVKIETKNICLYGNINLDNQEDIDLINRFNFINKEGSVISSNFNYVDGNCTTIDGKHKQYITNDVVLRFKYCYTLIGKPERIIVYKCIKK